MTLPIWFPTPPGVSTLPAAPAPTVNPTPMPPNAVAAPSGFDPVSPDLGALFGSVLPSGQPAVWAAEMTASRVIPAYQETIVESLMVRPVIDDQALPYPLTLPVISEAAVVRVVLESPDYLLQADVGAFALTGQAATLAKIVPTYILNAESGAFTLTGQAADLLKVRALTAETGVFALTGQAASLQAHRVLTAGTGSFILTGQDLAENINVAAITYSQSSVYPGTTAADNSIMTDKSYTNTGAATDRDDPAWVQMDLGSIYDVASVIVGTATNSIPGGWDRSYTENRNIQYSTDGTTWTTAVNTGTFASEGIYTFSFSFTARYIRLTTEGTSVAGPPGSFVAVSEFYALVAGQTY